MVCFIHRRELLRLKFLAERASKRGQREICGLAVCLSGEALSFFFFDNESCGRSSFSIGANKIEALERFLSSRGGKILASFHSHPISEAAPGPEDISNGFYNGHAAIYDVIGRKLKLWRKEGDAVHEIEAILGSWPASEGYEFR